MFFVQGHNEFYNIPMTSTNRIPSLLSPYLSPCPPNSLLLLTSVLGASTNWLLLRFLLATFSPKLCSESQNKEGSAINGGEAKVVFISFLRDWEFWRDGGKRLVGRLFLSPYKTWLSYFGNRGSILSSYWRWEI